MTVSDPGAGQQQGREAAEAFLARYDGVQAPDWQTGADLSRMGVPSPTPPARDSGRDEAREAVARWLWEQDGYAGSWEREDQQHYYREDADRLLALPELDKLLRRPA